MRHVGYNEYHRQVGESHHRAKLTDEDIERIRSLHEDGMTYSALAGIFNMAVSSIAKICRFERRNNLVVYWKVKK